MVLNRLHTKRINENRVIDQQHQGEVINLTVRALETYIILVSESLPGIITSASSKAVKYIKLSHWLLYWDGFEIWPF
jgi:hypothetical protein